MPFSSMCCFSAMLVVNHHHALVALNAPHKRFSNLPHAGGSAGPAGQKARDFVVAEVALQQGGQPCNGRLSKRTDQITPVEIK